MKEYCLFYDVAKYASENWKGNLSPKEIACNAYDYRIELALSVTLKKTSPILKELIVRLDEDGREEAKVFAEKIRRNLIGCL